MRRFFLMIGTARAALLARNGATRLRRLVLVVSFAFAAAALGGENAKPQFQVSVANLGVIGGTLQASEFVAQLGGDWCTAVAAPAAPRWNKRPESVPAEQWLSVVLTGFGRQAHAFVFMFDAPGGGGRLLAHVPYNMTWLPSNTMKWITPVSQIAGAVRVGYQRAPRPAPLPAFSVKLAEWHGADEIAPAETNASTATVPVRDALAAFEALAYAGLCANGWTPTPGTAAPSVRVELRMEFKAASLRLSREGGGASITRQKQVIPEDHYYAYLSRLVYLMKPDTGIADFTMPVHGRFRLLAATGERICGMADQGLVGVDPRSGKRLWPATLPKDASDAFIRVPGSSDVVRYSRGVALVDLASGAQKVLSNEVPGSPWSFALRDDGTTLVARAAQLSAHRNGAELWRNEESAAITAGPAISGDLVCAGTDDGDVICRGLSDGVEKWRRNAGGELRGYMVCADDSVLACTKSDDVLVALSAKDGTVQWKQAVGDVLLKAPVKVGPAWLVAGKNNRMLLLNPADGKISAEVRWPTWLVDVLAATVEGKAVVLCTDIRGRLSVLDSATLKTVREVILPGRPEGEIVYTPKFPSAWGTAGVNRDPLDILMEEPETVAKPAVLVTDKDGFCYIVSTK